MEDAIRNFLFCAFVLVLLPIVWVVFVIRLAYEAGMVGWNGAGMAVEWLLTTREK